MTLEKILYCTKVVSTGGREGRAESTDKALSVQLSTPKALGGSGGTGTNPEQLFAAGYSACFLSALKLVAEQHDLALPASTKVTAEVGIGPLTTGFGLEVRLAIFIENVPTEQAQNLVKQAHIICPYSNATRNNINVKLIIN